jgi:hypothetical protein
MSRKVLDLIASWIGAMVVVVLVVAGGLMLWGHSYVNNQVRDQLAMQQIYFPPATAFTHPTPPETTAAMQSTVGQYAGQQLLSGPQAEVYANDFIAHHLYAMPMHGVYSKISAASMANPKNTSLATLGQVSFKGTTLRAMLLEAYGFWKIGQVMLWGAIASFALAACMLALVILGFRHAAHTRREKEVFQRTVSTPVPIA